MYSKYVADGYLTIQKYLHFNKFVLNTILTYEYIFIRRTRWHSIPFHPISHSKLFSCMEKNTWRAKCPKQKWNVLHGNNNTKKLMTIVKRISAFQHSIASISMALVKIHTFFFFLIRNFIENGPFFMAWFFLDYFVKFSSILWRKEKKKLKQNRMDIICLTKPSTNYIIDAFHSCTTQIWFVSIAYIDNYLMMCFWQIQTFVSQSKHTQKIIKK